MSRSAAVTSVLVFGLAVVLAGRLMATSYFPYVANRVVDANGVYYAVTAPADGKPTGLGPVEITIARRAAGAAPVAPATAGVDLSRIAVAPGDTVLGKLTTIGVPPERCLVSTAGRGVVLVDRYGLNYLLAPGVAALQIVP